MKKILTLIFIIIISVISFGQNSNEVRASMGIDFVSVPSLKDYLELNYTDRLSDFSSAVNFSGAYGRMLGESSQLEFELGYFLNSYNSSSSLGNYDLTYSLLMPSVLYNYVISGNGYNFKFGGGAGLRFLSITEKRPGFLDDNYSSTGYGFILRGVGNTAIAQNVFAYISADIRYDILKESELSTEGNTIGDVNFSSLSFGVRLGISYQF